MSDRTIGLVSIGALLLLSFVFQYQMKSLANEIAPILARPDAGIAEKAGGLLRASIAVRLAFVLLLAASLFILWLLALTKLELSLALPLASVALVVNAVGVGLLLGEALTFLRVTGVVVVAIGIGLVLRS